MQQLVTFFFLHYFSKAPFSHSMRGMGGLLLDCSLSPGGKWDALRREHLLREVHSFIIEAFRGAKLFPF